jgi:hypothetical protein
MTDWLDPLVIVGAAQVVVAVALVYFTTSLARSTKIYSSHVERQTGIMQDNNKLTEDALKNSKESAEREKLLKRYERLSNEMVNFIAPLYSRVGDMQVFTIDMPKQKIEGRHGQIKEIPRETYSFWEDHRRNNHLNQSSEMQDALYNYFNQIHNIDSIKAKDPKTEADRAQLKKYEELFQKDRTSLFDAIRRRHSEVQKELQDLEKELGIQEKQKKARG